MVYDNRPAARKGDVLRWGLTWVVMAVLIRVPLWKGHVFAIPIRRSGFQGDHGENLKALINSIAHAA